MKLVYKQILWGLAGILIILSFACKAVSFGQPDIEETSQAEIDATKSTGIDSPDDVIPTAKSGEIIAAGEIEIFIPPETQEKQPLITAKPINEALPPAPDESTAIGQAYEITSEDELTGSVLISISYEPSDLPPGANEENLYIATLVGEDWQVVPDGFVDTENHTVNASVEHFSFFNVERR